MTVKELIEKLQKHDPDKQVLFREPYDEGDDHHINAVWDSEHCDNEPDGDIIPVVVLVN